MLDAHSWRAQLGELWGIQLLESYPARLTSALWTTRCSKTKLVAEGRPEALYSSYSNRFFYRFAQAACVRYAIVSDKYGIHFDDECLSYYDVHPAQLGEDDKRRLGRLVRDKAESRGYSELVFYNASPLMSVPYFQILACSGLKLYYTTRLPRCWSEAGH